MSERGILHTIHSFLSPALAILIGTIFHYAQAAMIAPVCRVSLTEGRYVFTAISHDPQLNDKLRATPFPAAIVDVEVWRLSGAHPKLLWSIEAEHDNSATKIFYGDVPSGFRQVFPHQGQPEPLAVGGEYRLNCPTPLRFRVTSDGPVVGQAVNQ